MQLQGDKTIRITCGSPYFPAYNGKVSEDGKNVTFPGGFGVALRGWHGGYESPRVEPETSGGDACYTYHKFEEDGTGALWQCVPCRVVYAFEWEYVEE